MRGKLIPRRENAGRTGRRAPLSTARTVAKGERRTNAFFWAGLKGAGRSVRQRKKKGGYPWKEGTTPEKKGDPREKKGKKHHKGMENSLTPCGTCIKGHKVKDRSRRGERGVISRRAATENFDKEGAI